jgi:hypothetical protein
LRARLTQEEEAAEVEVEVMAAVAAAAEVMVAAVVAISAAAAVHISAVVGTSAAVDISAAFALVECALAACISVARAAAAGPGYRGLRRDQVSAANARLRSTAIGPPAARRR